MKFGCGSAIKVNFIALTLHKLLTIKQQATAI
jgi:hypothetical protein